MTTSYHLNVDPAANREHPDSVNERLTALERWFEPRATVVESPEVTLEGIGPDWTDYLDLGLKALLVIAAFLIAARIGG